MKELRNLQNRWSSVYANLDLCAFNEQFRPAQMELSHKPNCSTILVHQRSPEKWIQPKNIKGRLIFVQIQNSIYLNVFLSLACRIEFEFQLPKLCCMLRYFYGRKLLVFLYKKSPKIMNKNKFVFQWKLEKFLSFKMWCLVIFGTPWSWCVISMFMAGLDLS